MYVYTARLVRVIDGDTVELEVDCGFRLTFRDRFRLAHIDAPEHDKSSTDYLAGLFASIPSPFIVKTTKPDKYGRWLVEIAHPGGGTLNDIMVDAGHAVPYEGGKK